MRSKKFNCLLLAMALVITSCGDGLPEFEEDWPYKWNWDCEQMPEGYQVYSYDSGAFSFWAPKGLYRDDYPNENDIILLMDSVVFDQQANLDTIEIGTYSLLRLLKNEGSLEKQHEFEIEDLLTIHESVKIIRHGKHSLRVRMWGGLYIP